MNLLLSLIYLLALVLCSGILRRDSIPPDGMDLELIFSWRFKDYKRRGYISSTCNYCSVAQSCPTLQPHGLQRTRLLCPSLIPGACSNSCPSSRWYHPVISSSVIPFSSCPNPSQHQSLFQCVDSLHEVAKVLEFQLQHQSFQWTPRTDLL